MSSFEFEFLFRICRRISNSNFSFRCSIRFLEFQFSIRISSSSSLNFRVEFRIRLFRFAALFDFSNFDSKVSLLYSTSRNRSSNSTSRSSTSRVKSLEFRIRLDLFDFSNFDDYQVLEFVVEIVAFVSHSAFEFLIELFNFRRNLIIINAIAR